MSEAGGVSVGNMYDAGRDQGYGGGAQASGRDHGRTNGGNGMNGTGGKESSEGALARFASASALASGSKPASSPSLGSTSAAGSTGAGAAAQMSASQVTPQLGNATGITTLPSFLAAYGGIAQSRPHTHSPTLSSQAPSHSPVVSKNPGQSHAPAQGNQDRLAKLHSSFGPLPSPPATASADHSSSMGINYFGTADGAGASGGLIGGRHASDGMLMGSAASTNGRNGHQSSDGLSPSDAPHQPAVEAPPTLHALLYGTGPGSGAAAVASGPAAQHSRMDPAMGSGELGRNGDAHARPFSANGGSFFDVRDGSGGAGTGNGSKDWVPQAKPQTIAERRASSNAHMHDQSRSSSYGADDRKVDDFGMAGRTGAAGSSLPSHIYPPYEQHAPYSASASPVDAAGNMVPAPWGFMLPNSNPLDGTNGMGGMGGFGDAHRSVSGYQTLDGSEYEASGSGTEGKSAAGLAQQNKGRAGNKRRQKFTRTRTGCLCCRSRRIKCDEGRPTCKRCIIAKRVYPEAAPDSRGNSEEGTPQAQGYDNDGDTSRGGKKQKMEHDRAFSSSIFQDRSVKIHPPPLSGYHQFQNAAAGGLDMNHSWPRVVHPPPVPLQAQQGQGGLTGDFSAPGRRGAVDGGDELEAKNWWGAHARDQRSMQEAAWLFGQGLGTLNTTGGLWDMQPPRRGSSAGSEASVKPDGLEVTLSDGLFQSPPSNSQALEVPGMGAGQTLARMDLGIRRFSDGVVPQAVNPQVLTTVNLDSYLQPVEPGHGAYSAARNPPFITSSSVPLPAPRNLQPGSSFDYSRALSSLGPHSQANSMVGSMSPPSVRQRRLSSITLSGLSLGPEPQEEVYEPPVLCGNPMELMRPTSQHSIPSISIHQPSRLFQDSHPLGQLGQVNLQQQQQPLTPDSALGLVDNNVIAEQTGVVDSTNIFGAGAHKWDETYVPGYQLSNDPSVLDSTVLGGNALAVQRQQPSEGGDTNSQTVPATGQPWQDPGLTAAMQAAPQFLSTPNFLLPWFPTSEERSLILHYCANAADLMMAIPSGLNPMLAINLPLALHSPRGSSPACDALRVALLGIGAIHQAFLLARSGISTSQTATMFQYAAGLRDTGKEMVRRAMISPGGAQSDATLGAVTSLALIDIFFGGSSWRENFEYARQMIASRGGPAKMLKSSQPTPLADGVTVSAARLNLEILAIYETMGCLTTSEEPLLLSDKWESWWFESSRSTYEEHSVEKQFGMSRTMVHLFSRLTRLLSRTKYSSLDFTEADNQYEPGANSTPTVATEPLILEARKLNDDVDAWIESLAVASLEHERVQVGNKAYAHAMKILLLRNVFDIPRLDPRVQQNASDVLRHCSTSTALLGMSIDLTWPAIIAACCVDHSSRQWVLTLLEGFKSQCCFDIDTAARIIQEVWRRVDRGDARDDWREVCEDLGLQVL